MSQDRPKGRKGRRGFLGALLGAGAGLVLLLGRRRPAEEPPARTGPEERPLCEADFYRPHDLAG